MIDEFEGCLMMRISALEARIRALEEEFVAEVSLRLQADERIRVLEQDRLSDHDRRLKRLEGAREPLPRAEPEGVSVLGDQRETVRVGRGFHPPLVRSHRIPVRIPEDDDGA